MNKPNWEDAPRWAKYLAMDEENSWYWYEYTPEFRHSIGVWAGTGMTSLAEAGDDRVRAVNTLEVRP